MEDQRLMEPEVIRPEHFTALAYSDAAEDALVAICAQTSHYIEALHGAKATSFEEAQHKRSPTPAYGWNYWEAWSLNPPSQDLEDLWLDWNARNRPQLAEAEGRSLVFIAGLCADSHANLTGSDEERHRYELLTAGARVDGRDVRFRRLTDDANERFAQLAFPEEVLVGRTLEAQARSLAEWIVGFRALTVPLEELTPARRR